MRIFLAALLFAALAAGRAEESAPVHPRLFIDPPDVAAVRARAAGPAFAPVLASIRSMIDGADPFGADNRKTFGNRAALYLATGDRRYADEARDEMLAYISQTDVWANPSFKALSRASLARGGAMTYDICHGAWAGQKVPASVDWKGKTYQLPPALVGMDLNAAVSRSLLEAAAALVKSGGKDWPGGGKPGNNWNGVRYGAALLALMACDEPITETQPLFDTSLRIFRQYLDAAFTRNPAARGWNSEGYGYTFYPAQFTYPAAIALSRLRGIDLLKEVPAFRASLGVLFHGLVALPQRHAGGYLGLHPDFTDDNADWIGEGVANIAMALAPDDQKPALRWMYRRAFGDLGDGSYDAASSGGLFALLYLDPDAAAANPAEVTAFGLNFSDPHHGFFSLRKAYGEPAGLDVLAQFMAKTALSQGGHAAPDGLAFRIWGLGVPWTVGSGRTTDPAGQCAVFAGEPEEAVFQSQVHRVIESYLRPAGGGTLVVKAQPFSDTGVRDQTRRFVADYRPATGAEAAFVVADTSANGRLWRLNTPGVLADGKPYNVISTEPGGFSIVNQASGSRLVGRVLMPAKTELRTGTFKRGSPMSVPLGLGRKDGAEAVENAWVDFRSENGTFVVVLLLLRQDQPVPPVSGDLQPDGSGTVRVGTATYSLAGDSIRVSGWERPVVEVESPRAESIYPGGQQPVEFTGRARGAAGPASSVTVSVDGGAPFAGSLSGGTWSAKSPPLPPGRHEAVVRAADALGETNESLVVFRISRSRPPSLTLESPAREAVLPAGADVTFSGTVSDPDGPPPSAVELLSEEGKVLASGAPSSDGRWSLKLPGSAFGPGKYLLGLRAADSAGDVSELPNIRLVASSKFSDSSPFGDLAEWTRESEWRVSLQQDNGNLRYAITPSEGYQKRRGLSYLAGRQVAGNFRVKFRARLMTAASVFQVRFGREAFLTFGGPEAPAPGPPGIGFTAPQGENSIGRWTSPLVPDMEWHVFEITRTPDGLLIHRDGAKCLSLVLHTDRTVSVEPEGAIDWDPRNGPGGKRGGALVRLWGAGPIGFGCPFQDASSIQMDDFEFEEPAP